MTREEARIRLIAKREELMHKYMVKDAEVLTMAIEALQTDVENELKFYYVESLDDYWVGQRLDNFYYATWHGRLGFVWSHSKHLPWGEHIVDENTLWKEHTYPSEPIEIPFTEWIVGFVKKYSAETDIVRCKDCKWATETRTKSIEGDVTVLKTCPSRTEVIEDEDFCSYGERISNEITTV